MNKAVPESRKGIMHEEFAAHKGTLDLENE